MQSKFIFLITLHQVVTLAPDLDSRSQYLQSPRMAYCYPLTQPNEKGENYDLEIDFSISSIPCNKAVIRVYSYNCRWS